MVKPQRTTEIEIELKNEPGTLGEAASELASEGINILGFTCAADGSKGRACFVTSDPSRATQTLESAGFKPKSRESLFVPTPNEPGQLAELSQRLGASGINIERSFVSVNPDTNELGIGFSVDKIDQATKVLQG